MITLTANAVNHLKSLLAERAAAGGEGLRLSVEKGGCAGMQYTMRIDTPGVQDQVFATDGVSVIVDLESLKFLERSSVDYEDSLHDAGFKLHNPNAARSCGCGTSFEPASGI
jgi:iron-sulfur cluster assembly protein